MDLKSEMTLETPARCSFALRMPRTVAGQIARPIGPAIPAWRADAWSIHPVCRLLAARLAARSCAAIAQCSCGEASGIRLAPRRRFPRR